MESNYLSSIPLEIIELILENENLTFVDICNFGCTCSQYWQLVTKCNQIWKTKFQQMWPHLLKNEAYIHYPVSKWFDEFRLRWSIGQQAKQLLNAISTCHIKHEELLVSDLKKIDNVLHSADHRLRLQFMIDELMLCIHHKNRNTNLTNKYYSEKVLRYLRQIELRPQWEEFKNTDPDEQLLEKGAVIAAQWSQPAEDITYQSIALQLDTIAKEVFERIRMEYGDKHEALQVPVEVRSLWHSHNLADNYYSPHVSRQVINAVSAVLFKEMGFNGNNDLYYSYENACINKVLEERRGIPITLAILFESITRRLGVKCEPVAFPGHFLLRWRDTYKKNVPTQYFYIDVFSGGKFLGKDSCPQFSNSQGRCPIGEICRFGPASAVQVMEKLANSLEVAGRQCTTTNGRSARIRSALELLHLVAPTNVNCLLQLARCYMQNNMDVSSLRQTLETVRHFQLRDMGQASYILATLRDYDNTFSQYMRDSSDNLEVKKREGSNQIVQFAVGMVMHHRKFNYTCVVVGWDSQCVASEEWIVQMNVKSLSRQEQQPFYHVLVNDGTNRYAAEENLEVETSPVCWVTHCDVGRYFDTFCLTHYLPNPELLQAYPDDLPVLHRCLGLK